MENTPRSQNEGDQCHRYRSCDSATVKSMHMFMDSLFTLFFSYFYLLQFSCSWSVFELFSNKAMLMVTMVEEDVFDPSTSRSCWDMVPSRSRCCNQSVCHDVYVYVM